MKHIKNSLFAFGGIGLLICTITLATNTRIQGQEPVGPTKPVLVVNTPGQPVPVTGTITGIVTLGNTPSVNVVNTPGVNVINTPTVKIDPTGNVVAVASRPTQLIANTGIYDVSAGGYPAIGPFDVASFSKIRVVVFNQNNSDGPFIVFVSVRLPGGLIFSLDGTNFATLQPGQSFSRVYEVPGQFVQVNVGGNGPNRNGAIAVFGN